MADVVNDEGWEWGERSAREAAFGQVVFSGTETGDVVLVVASSGAVKIDGLAVGLRLEVGCRAAQDVLGCGRVLVYGSSQGALWARR